MVSQDIDHALLIKIICFLKRQTILDLIYIYIKYLKTEALHLLLLHSF